MHLLLRRYSEKFSEFIERRSLALFALLNIYVSNHLIDFISQIY